MGLFLAIVNEHAVNKNAKAVNVIIEMYFFICIYLLLVLLRISPSDKECKSFVSIKLSVQQKSSKSNNLTEFCSEIYVKEKIFCTLYVKRKNEENAIDFVNNLCTKKKSRLS